jgi:hypothetical protein
VVQGPSGCEDADVAGADLDDEEAVPALERDRAVHVKEVHRKHRRRLRPQELPPGRIGAPLRRGWYLQLAQDPADGARADPVADLEQLTLDRRYPRRGSRKRAAR